MLPRLTPTPLPEGDPPGERVGLDAVLAELDHRLHRAFAPGLRVRRAMSWERADRHDPQWWPQGLTSSADAGRGDRLLLASWYSKSGLGTRVSVIDLAARRYRHVWLAVARDGALTPLAIHAGGLMWRGPWLYVAATRRGCYLAHVDDLLRVGGEFVWPVRLHYAARDGLRYSFLSLTDTEELLVGEYGGPERRNRLVRFPLEPSGLLRVDAQGIATATSVDRGVPSMQGAVLRDGRYRLMVSRGRRRPGDVWSGRAADLRRRSMAVPPGTEDATWSQGRVWSVTEFPGRRWIYAASV